LLQDLFAGAILDAKAREELVALSDIEKLALEAPEAIKPHSYLLSKSHINVIAEIKRASPSRGFMATIENPGELARTYEAAGAGAVSVLTESRQFGGSLQDLEQVRSCVTVPVLRKDFIASDYQIFEARALGADLVLLIAAGLERNALSRLKGLIDQLGMTALIETHSEDEILFACEIGAELIGINTRDLQTFQTNRELFGELASSIDTDAIKIAESSVRNVSDVEQYASYGADCVLVGEALVTGDAADLVSSFSQVMKP
jgi:indole-3-glycerol phosphate synthase